MARIGVFFLVPFMFVAGWFGGWGGTPPQPAPAPIYIPPPVPATPTPSLPTPPSAPTTPPNTSVVLNAVIPSSGVVGATVTLRGSGFTADNTVLFDGNVAARDVQPPSIEGTQELVFVVPNSLAPDCKPTQACPMYLRVVTSGTYSVSVENQNGISNALTFAVTGAQQL